MKARLVIGGEMDVVSPDELHDALGDLRHSLARPNRVRPIRLRRTDSVTYASYDTMADLGGPASGRLWSVTNVAIMGSDDHTTVASTTAAVHIGDPTIPILGAVVATGQSVPYTWNFSRHTIWVHPGERLYVPVYGAANGTTLVAVATVMEYPDANVEASLA